MCGIWCAFSKSCTSAELIKYYDLNFKERIQRRGPNYHRIESIEILNGFNIVFAAGVLWLQGSSLTKQPVVSDKSLFLFNGDVFESDSFEDDLKIIGDTKLLHKIFESTADIKESMMKLKGPYAFMYFDKINNILHFGRDPYGRRSMLIGKATNNTFVLTSVANKCSDHDFIELPALGIYSINLSSFEIEVTPWNSKHDNFDNNISILQRFLHSHIKIQDVEAVTKMTPLLDPCPEELQILDCIHKTDSYSSMQHLLNQNLWHRNITQFSNILREAVQKRIENQPRRCQSCLDFNFDISCHHAYVGVLFSGGLDCSVLALLVEEFINANNPIDLINVSFDEKNNFKSPDRLTAEATLEELRVLKPQRQWNFVPVNITSEELNEWRSKRISDLIYPLNSILDDSLGCALWFASRGLNDSYKSPCRVLVVGMGADELLGGYTKHRRAFQRGSWLGLNDSLNMDWQNISVRNLARDDRVISDHGRQLRTPYLDEHVVEFLRSLPTWQKMYLHDDVAQGIGDKIILRTLAYHLGFRRVSAYKKRALQFGSRIANSKENANDISPRL